MGKRSATILDVASAAGVSTATVSRVLNGGQASGEARAAVTEAVERLGYRRNDLARGLVTGRTGVVGVLIPDVSGPLYSQMATGIDDVLGPLGMHYMMVSDNRQVGQEAEALELLLGKQVDALIIVGSQLRPERLQRLLRGGPPAVLVQREWEGNSSDFTTVSLDNEGGVTAALTYIVSKGHDRIAHIAGVRREGAERAARFRTHLYAQGIEIGPVLESDSREEGGYRAGKELLEYSPVSAVFCANDRVALGLYRAARERGLSIPDEVSVVGFDDLHWSAYLDPPLTTVRQPARKMGRLAAEHVLAALSGDRQVIEVAIESELVERESVADVSGARGGDIGATSSSDPSSPSRN